MDPVSIALGIASFVAPKVGKWLFGDDGEKVAEEVVGIAKDVTATDDGQDALEKIASDPALAAEVKLRLLDLHEKMLEEETKRQIEDTKRFVAMNDGDAEKIKSTARPEIAKKAMDVLTIFARGIRVLFWATIAEWAIRLGCYFAGVTYPEVSLWGLIAEAQPVSEMIWAPLLASFYASIQIITKYMGCRERDKAHEYEIQAGKPLSSTAATVEAAGGVVSSLIKAVKRG